MMNFIAIEFLTFLLVYFKIGCVESHIVPRKTLSFINTHNHCNTYSNYRRNPIKHIVSGSNPEFKRRVISLKASDDLKGDFSKALNDKYPDFDRRTNVPVKFEPKFGPLMDLREVLAANSGTMIMVSIYVIRIFRLLVYARAFLDSLIHINPYLPPFNIIYDTTNFYIKCMDAMPSVLGVNIFSQIPSLLLSGLERYLFSLLNRKN